jgi:hypothetical protein
MADYAIWTETAEFARGYRPDFISQSLNAGALPAVGAQAQRVVRMRDGSIVADGLVSAVAVDQ